MGAQNLGIGRTVHVRIGGSDDKPTLRPAVVVRVWDPTMANLQLFTDGENDRADLEAQNVMVENVVWMTSVHEGLAVGQWRWPERV